MFPRTRLFRLALAAALVFLPASALSGAVPPPVASPLAQSVSPYLRLHADDPVAWREWSPALLDEARARGKPLFLSSGYYACHWCHVMQQESFRNPEIAARLNRDYIPVKIDRELHGALDLYLLEFLRAVRGRAGWPLNVVVLPGGDALTGVVYEPPAEFAQFLDGITARLRADGAALTELAREAREELAERLRAGGQPLSPGRAARLPEALWAALKRDADLLGGGFGNQAKFPQAPVLEALLEALRQGRAPDWAGEFIAVTLDEMASAGLRDVIGGGFFRYSETPDWGWPHFEVMLEDQAQLARLYQRAARVLQRPDWALIGHGTLHFVLAQMALDPPGLYASALSAVDAAGREGGGYLWTSEQIEAALEGHPRPDVVRAHFALDGAPTFDEGFLPKERLSFAETARRHSLSVAEAGELIESGRFALLAARATRSLPRDEKPIAGLHGLLLSAFAEAADEPEFAAAGAALEQRLRTHIAASGSLPLLLAHPDDRAGTAELADYAQLASGLHAWSLATRGTPDPDAARLLERAWREFSDPDGWHAARNPPLPGMIAQRFHASLHRPSPTSLLLALSREYAADHPELARKTEQFDWRPGRAIETEPIPHAELIVLLSTGH